MPDYDTLIQNASKRGWLTVNEAATYLAVTPATIRRWVHSGALKGWRIGPKLIRIDLNEAREFRHSVSD